MLKALEVITWTVDGANATIGTGTEGRQGAYGTILSVGNSVSFVADTNSHVVGVGIFNDGTRQVLVDTYI